MELTIGSCILGATNKGGEVPPVCGVRAGQPLGKLIRVMAAPRPQMFMYSNCQLPSIVTFVTLPISRVMGVDPIRDQLEWAHPRCFLRAFSRNYSPNYFTYTGKDKQQQPSAFIANRQAVYGTAHGWKVKHASTSAGTTQCILVASWHSELPCE